jgi:Papain-like cysteine protease AvrRpt2
MATTKAAAKERVQLTSELTRTPPSAVEPAIQRLNLGDYLTMPTQFQIEPQQQSEWCWAAVAVSIDKYFSPNSTRTQCEIAGLVLGSGNACCNNAGANCNHPATLVAALQKIYRWSRTIDRPLRFEEIRQELDARRPVCARIQWKGGSAHFVVLVGYDVLQSGARHVVVEDPLNPSSTIDYDEFKTAYYGDGTWVDSYLVTESKKVW